jgi:hypothetical protein
MIVNQQLKVFKRGQLDSKSPIVPNHNRKFSDSDSSLSSISANSSFTSYDKPKEIKKQFKFGNIAPPPVNLPAKLEEKPKRISIKVSDESDEETNFANIKGRIAKRLGASVNNYIKTEEVQKKKTEEILKEKEKPIAALFDKIKKPVFLHAKKPSSDADSLASSAFNTEDKPNLPEPDKLSKPISEATPSQPDFSSPVKPPSNPPQPSSKRPSGTIANKQSRKKEIEELKEEVSKLRSKLVFPNQVLIPGLDPPAHEDSSRGYSPNSSFSSSSDESLPRYKAPNIRKHTINTETSLSSSVFNSGGDVDTSLGEKSMIKGKAVIGKPLSHVNEVAEEYDNRPSLIIPKDLNHKNIQDSINKGDSEKTKPKSNNTNGSMNILAFLKTKVAQNISGKNSSKQKDESDSSSEEISQSITSGMSSEEESKHPIRRQKTSKKASAASGLKLTSTTPIKHLEQSNSSPTSPNPKESKIQFHTDSHFISRQRDRGKSVKFDLEFSSHRPQKTEARGSILINKIDSSQFLKKVHKIKLMTRLEEDEEDANSKYSIDIYAFPTADQLPKAPSRRIVNTVFPSMHLGTRRGSNSILIFADTAELPLTIRSKCQRVPTTKKDEVTTAPRLSRPVTTSDLEKMARLLAGYIISSRNN